MTIPESTAGRPSPHNPANGGASAPIPAAGPAVEHLTRQRGRARASRLSAIEADTQRMWDWYTRINERTLADVAERYGLRPSTVADRFWRRGLLVYGKHGRRAPQDADRAA